MIRLTDSTITDLVNKFIAANTEDKRQSAVDCLGKHPANHAKFAYNISNAHPHFWNEYLRLTQYL